MKYYSMSRKEWTHLISDYVRGITKMPELNITQAQSTSSKHSMTLLRSFSKQYQTNAKTQKPLKSSSLHPVSLSETQMV